MRKRRVVLACLTLLAAGCEGLIGANFDQGAASEVADGDPGAMGEGGSTADGTGAADSGAGAKDAGSADAKPRGDAAVVPPASCGDMSGYAASAWPMGGFCPTRPNQTSAPALASPHILWRYDYGPPNGQEFVSGPALTSDGTVLAAAGYFTDGGPAYALFAVKNKIEQWRAPLPLGVAGTPTVARDGTIYVHAAQMLVALHADGSPKWTLPLSGLYIDMPVILGDGTVVVLDGKQMVFVEPVAGTVKSTYPLGSGNTPTFAAEIAVSPQGVLYALAAPAPGNLNALLYGINASAVLTFASPITLNGGLPGSPPLGPAFDAQGNLLVMTSSEISMWTPQGQAAGSSPSGRAPCQTLGARADNVFWFPSRGGSGPFTYDTSNQQLTDHASVAGTYSGMVVVADGSVVFARYRSSASPKIALEAFGPDATSRWTVPLDTISSDFNGLAVGADGTVYVPFGPTLYAIGD